MTCSTDIIPILPTKQLRLREVILFVQSHTSRELLSQDLNLVQSILLGQATWQPLEFAEEFLVKATQCKHFQMQEESQ